MTVGDLVHAYTNEVAAVPDATVEHTKRNTLKMLELRLINLELESIDAGLSRFIMARSKEGADGVTIAADLSFLSTVLRWDSVAKNRSVAT